MATPRRNKRLKPVRPVRPSKKEVAKSKAASLTPLLKPNETVRFLGLNAEGKRISIPKGVKVLVYKAHEQNEEIGKEMLCLLISEGLLPASILRAPECTLSNSSRESKENPAEIDTVRNIYVPVDQRVELMYDQLWSYPEADQNKILADFLSKFRNYRKTLARNRKQEAETATELAKEAGESLQALELICSGMSDRLKME